MFELRPYQQDAASATWEYLHSGRAGLIVCPTGAGKSLLIADIAKRVVDTGGRVGVFTHVRELVKQNHDQFVRMVGAFAPAGIYSAGLKSRDTRERVIFAGIQSAYKRAEEFGRFDLAIIDEAHLVPRRGQGRYRTFLADAHEINPNLILLGYTATPYRLDGGSLHKGEGALFEHVVYDVKMERLIREGFLAPLVAKEPRDGVIDASGLRIENGDFTKDDLERAARESNVEAACDEMIRLGAGRRSWLVFCCSVNHAKRVAEILGQRGVSARTIFGATEKDERDDTVRAFKDGGFTALVNCSVLTTGFDAPNVDLLALMRPTQSQSLYVQMCGRGTRTAEGKTNCLLLDYGGNVERHGPVNRIDVQEKNGGDGLGPPPMKTCPQCDTFVPAGTADCPECDYKWRKECPECGIGCRMSAVECDRCHFLFRKLEVEASTAAPVDTGDARAYLVDYMYFERWRKQGKPDSMCVSYVVRGRKFPVREWVCLEHDGYALTKARKWWLFRSRLLFIAPPNVQAALERAGAGELAIPYEIKVAKDGKYERIVGYVWVEGAPDASPQDPRVRRDAHADVRVLSDGNTERIDCPDDDDTPF
jgi:DNA repair protein RadD